jgi:hypothetical protein
MTKSSLPDVQLRIGDAPRGADPASILSIVVNGCWVRASRALECPERLDFGRISLYLKPIFDPSAALASFQHSPQVP